MNSKGSIKVEAKDMLSEIRIMRTEILSGHLEIFSDANIWLVDSTRLKSDERVEITSSNVKIALQNNMTI